MPVTFNGVSAAIQSPKEAFKYYGELSTKDFEALFDSQFVMLVGFDQSNFLDSDDPNFGDVDGQCTKGYGIKVLELAYKLVRTRPSVERFLELHHDDGLSMRLFNGTVSFIDPLVFALPLMIGLFVSFNLTLWLLSRIVQSRLTFMLIVIADVGLAFAMPAVLSALMLTLMLVVVFHLAGGIPNFATFEEPTWITMGISTIGTYFYYRIALVLLSLVRTMRLPSYMLTVKHQA
jgi:hypothetical protein